MRKYKVAVVQLDSQNDKAANLERVSRLIDEAAAGKASLVSLPEAMNFTGERVREEDQPEPIPGPSTEMLREKAVKHGLWIHSGSFAEINPEDKRHYNTSLIISDKGEIVAKYRKIHTFDVTLPDGTVCDESTRVTPGQKIVVADTPLGKLGLSICYDIRFPELFRLMAMEGAQVLFTPANFALPTGKDHWEAILRVRAIENGCYVVAAAQIGKKRRFAAYGGSMVVDPWGTVLTRAREEEGLSFAEIDLDYLDKIRERLPSL
ncbi:MAG: carbon-nitrogen hydrolase family protein, partial [Synergistaceae bacterium]|nr:carbon-nitrogen hydrolase family protein [Synergistaceae bacterium]